MAVGTKEPIVAKRKNGSISATALASFVTCQKQTLLRQQHGELDTLETAKAKRRGNQGHNQYHNRVIQHYAGKSNKHYRRRACYISSAVFGIDSPETNVLRQWRDSVLLNSILGRLMVNVYYRVTPVLLKYAGKNRFFIFITAWCLRIIIKTIKKRSLFE